MSRYLVIAVLIAVAVFAFMAKHRSADDQHHVTPSHQQTCDRLAHYLGSEARCPW
jgi:hypothetical protein